MIIGDVYVNKTTYLLTYFVYLTLFYVVQLFTDFLPLLKFFPNLTIKTRNNALQFQGG